MHNLLQICLLLLALLLPGAARAQDDQEVKVDSCETVLSRLESAFRSETIDKHRKAWLASAVEGVSSAWRVVPEKAVKRLERLDRELRKSEFRMPAELHRNATALVQSLQGCSRSTEAGPEGEVVVTVMHHDWESLSGDWVRVGAGYDVHVDGEWLGQTDKSGQLRHRLPEGSYEVHASKAPNEAWFDVVEIQAYVTTQITLRLADDKEVSPPCDLRINDTEELVLPTPPNPVELSFWFNDVKIPLSEIRFVGIESEQNPTEVEFTEDFTLVDSVATLTQTARLSEFLAGVEGAVTLSFYATGVDDTIYSIIVEVWPGGGSVGVVEQQEAGQASARPAPRSQVRLRHPKSGMAFYLPEGVLEAQPVTMPRGEVLVEYGFGQVYRPLTRFDLRHTECVRLFRKPTGTLTVISPGTRGSERKNQPMGMLKAWR